VKVQPPLTPMIDVTFLLLLYFLLTTTFRQQEGQIPATLPQLGAISIAQREEVQPLRITIIPAGIDRSACRYEMSSQEIAIESPEKLYEALLAYRQASQNDDVPVMIQSRRDVRWQHVVEAFNQAVRARFKRIGFSRLQGA
jgi:biopolymer transport protein ExbD